mmetsp:Transcript_126390/g.369292  ORF Transcript_126390/g.369292 Transcript_126390/m.369292 type:complete len:215 (+) Transcript_126390:1214-1858(+)
MEAMQRSSSWRGHPGRARTGHGLCDLGLEHGLHAVRLSPHALADLAFALEARDQADVNIGVLICLEPRLKLHVSLPDHWTRKHASMDFITRAVHEARVDEEDSVRSHPDTLAKVHACAPLLVQDTQLDGVPAEAEQLLHHTKEVVREPDLSGPVHLWLYNVNAARPAVADPTDPPDIVEGGSHCGQEVQEAFGHWSAVGGEDGVSEEVVANVPH